MRTLKLTRLLLPLAVLSASQLSYAATSIADIKPLSGPQCKASQVIVEGVISHMTPDRLNGFFLQQGDKSARQGVFVEGLPPFMTLTSGDNVQVNAWRSCNTGTLQLKNLTLLDHNKTVTPVKIPKNTPLQALAPWEGLLVEFDQDDDLVINNNHSFDFGSRRARIELSRKQPIIKPTQQHPANSPQAKQLAQQNKQNRILLISDQSTQKEGAIDYFPNQHPETNYMRVGDKIKSLTAIVAKENGRFVLIPVKPLSSDNLIRQHPRSDKPKENKQSDLRIASFNLLNYFNTTEWFAANNPTGQNRGADNRSDLKLQTQKLVNAIIAMDADAVGLLEIENNGFGRRSAMHKLLSAINEQLPPAKHYTYVSPQSDDRIGGDAITTGLIYRPTALTPEGSMKIIPMPEQQFSIAAKYDKPPQDYKASLGKASARPTVRTAQYDAHPRMRNSVLQTFTHKKSDEQLTIVVNHLKSKGSKCFEDFDLYKNDKDQVEMNVWGYTTGAPTGAVDVQGSCNNLRVAAADTLGQYLKKESANIANKVLVLGDMNAYAKEDPIRLLTGDQLQQYPVTTSKFTFLNGQELPSKQTNQGYQLTNLVTQFNPQSYSYKYAGEMGTLDYALANKALLPFVVDAYDWHINSTESELFEYSSKKSGQVEKSANLFSSSDHDPVIIELNMNANQSTKR